MGKYIIKDTDLKKAAVLAKMEADRWRKAARLLNENCRLDREAHILSLLSSEIYMKALLMFVGVNVTEKHEFKRGNGHSLYFLFGK